MKGIQLDKFDLKISSQTQSDGKIQGIVIDNILSQNQAVIIDAFPGEIKENPILGVGITDMTNDEDLQYWKSRIREHLELDGQNVESVKLTLSGLIIKADYENRK